MEKWRLIQKKGFSNLEQIADFLNLDEENRNRLIDRKDFPLHLPLRLAKKIPKNCLKNPIARQFLPFKEEVSDDGGEQDPVGDNEAAKSKALLHKYEGRALLLTTGACVMHCRYCFRQNYAYESDIDKALRIVSKDISIKELILSGGDPLSLSDRKLEELLQRIEEIDHIKIIRFHTRFLIGLPERVTEKLLRLLKGCSKQIIFVIHINTIEECDEEIFSQLTRIQSLGIPVLTQTVLLRGINDSKQALYRLFLGLVSKGIIPYYLHAFDKVKGGMHYKVSKKEGVKLVRGLRDCLPGYAVPQFVEEIKGKSSKTIINI